VLDLSFSHLSLPVQFYQDLWASFDPARLPARTDYPTTSRPDSQPGSFFLGFALQNRPGFPVFSESLSPLTRKINIIMPLLLCQGLKTPFYWFFSRLG